jgi:hypothetical protein
MERNRITKIGVLGLATLLATILSGCGPAANNASQGNNANTAANVNANSGSNANMALSGCDDKDIDKTIRKKIKESEDFEKIRKQINWNTKNCVVELIGWVEFKGEPSGKTNDRYMAFKQMVLGISKDGKARSNDVSLNDENFKRYEGDLAAEYLPVNGSCTSGYEPCGDICVPIGQCFNESMFSTSPSPK